MKSNDRQRNWRVQDNEKHNRRKDNEKPPTEHVDSERVKPKKDE